jgi:copper transport protein
VRRLGRLGLVVLWVGAALFVTAAPAHAHAALEEADPPQGASLTTSPSALTLTFTEAPDPELSVIRILDAAGKPVDQGEVEPVAGRPESLRVTVSPLAQGTYTVSWQTLSAVDGHSLRGSYGLGVGVPAPARPVAAATSNAYRPTVLAVAGRAGFYIGLVALFGAAWMAALVVPGTSGALVKVIAVAWVLAGLGVVAITHEQLRAADVAWGDLLSTSLSDAFLWRVVPMAVVGNALVLIPLTTDRARRAALVVVAGGALGAMVGDVTSSHAAASASRWVQGTVQAVHFVAAATWIGGLGALLLASRRLEGQALERAARRFSGVAGVSLAVVVATGAVRAFNDVGGWGRLVDTGFGRLVLLKSTLLLLLAGLGGVNRFRHVPAVQRSVRGLRRVGTAELGVAAVVLVATGLLVNLAPGGTGARAASGTRPVRVTGADFGTTTRVTLEADPGTVGPNRFTARVVDYDSGAPVDVDRIRLEFSAADRPDVGSSVLGLPRTGPGRYTGEGANLSLEGRWSVRILVPRGTEAVEVPLELTTRKPTQRVEVDRRPGLPAIYTVTLAGSSTVQIYLDPGRPGPNDLHVTFFDAGGAERPVDSLTGTATGPTGTTTALEINRLTPGHFSASTNPVAGRWRYALAGSANGVPVAAEVAIDVGG